MGRAIIASIFLPFAIPVIAIVASSAREDERIVMSSTLSILEGLVGS